MFTFTFVSPPPTALLADPGRTLAYYGLSSCDIINGGFCKYVECDSAGDVSGGRSAVTTCLLLRCG